MNRLTKQCIVSVLVILGFFFIVGIAGSYEYADEIVYTMPDHVYSAILDTLGDECSNKEVAAEYMSKREYYDNLKY